MLNIVQFVIVFQVSWLFHLHTFEACACLVLFYDGEEWHFDDTMKVQCSKVTDIEIRIS